MNVDRLTHARRIQFLFSFVLAIIIPVDLAAQATSHIEWIFLSHRTPTVLSPQALGISERAMKRRAKVLPPNRLIDQFDEPIPGPVLDQIRATGATIRTTSRWLNAVSVEATDQQLRRISALPAVASIRPVARLIPPRPHAVSEPSAETGHPLRKSTVLDYGPSYDQLNTIGIVKVQGLGINGSGVVLGLLDDGFNFHRTHVALKNIHVVAEYDFIHNNSNTEAQPWEDPAAVGWHGTGVLSSVAGYDPGTLIGGAFGVSVMLARTEMDSSGNNADFGSEEDTYVAGLEWMERLGADIASSSLGYKTFLPPDTSYTYSSMDGHTTVVAKAASVAAQKGLLLLTAMGNDGQLIGNGAYALGTINSPADADSIVAVGATSLDGSSLASFSGTGPTADGRVKPEVVAPGMDVLWAYGFSDTNQFWTVQGTSAATPLAASVAALVLSAHPGLTPMEIRDALINTADPLSAAFPSLTVPNNYFGYGLVNAYDAVLHNGLVFSNEPIITDMDSLYVVTTWIAAKTPLLADSTAFYYRYPGGTAFTRVALLATVSANQYRAMIPKPPAGVIPVGYFSAQDASGKRTSPYDAPASLFTIVPTPDSVRQFYPPVDKGTILLPIPADYALAHNFPNPFNSTTTIDFYTPTTDRVELVVFNLLGQRIKTLFDGIPRADWNAIQWNGAQDNGRPVASGIYFARLKTPHSVLTVKMVYLK